MPRASPAAAAESGPLARTRTSPATTSGGTPGTAGSAPRPGGERAALVQLADVSEPLPETAPGLLPGSGRSGGGDLAGALQDRAGGRVTLADDLPLLVPDPADVEPAAPGQDLLGPDAPDLEEPGLAPAVLGDVGDLVLGADRMAAFRIPGQHAGHHRGQVDPHPGATGPGGGGPLPGEDQDDGCLALLGGQELQDLARALRFGGLVDLVSDDDDRRVLRGSAGRPNPRSRRRSRPAPRSGAAPSAARP